METTLLDRGLPKWPQMIVTGTSVTEEQALEIIRRTDSFWRSAFGNDKVFVRNALEAVGHPGDWLSVHGMEDFEKYWKAKERWEAEWGYIGSEYIINSWISCAWLGGPHGWCHPDGKIGFCNNVGKWPDIEEIYSEWKAVAEEFPFLELEVTLMSDEEGCNGHPVVSFLIRNGCVELVDPAERDLHKEFERTMEDSVDVDSAIAAIVFGGHEREHAIPMSQIEKWGSDFKARKKEEVREEKEDTSIW